MHTGQDKARSLADLIRTPLPEAPCYVYPALLPKRAKLLFGGSAKAGKSFMCLELIRALATGQSPFGHPGFFMKEPVRVLLVEQELGEWGLQKRVRKIFGQSNLGQIEDMLYYVSRDPDIVLSLPDGRGKLERYIEQVQPQVLVLDPIGKMHFYDENDATQIAKLFNSLDKILRDFSDLGLSIIFSHHFNKPPNQNGLTRDDLSPYNFRGSTKWYDDPDTLVTVHRMKSLPLPWEAWNLKVRWQARQGETPKESILSVNRDGDNGRVRYEHDAEEHAVLPEIQRPRPTRTFAEAPQAEQRKLFTPA